MGIHGLARWRQSLIWHEQVLELDSSLASYGISCEDATLQLVMSSPLDEKDMRRIIDLQESCERSVQALTKGSLEELLGLINPPAACELVVRASVRLITCFSPSSLIVNKDIDFSWNSCQRLLRSISKDILGVLQSVSAAITHGQDGHRVVAAVEEDLGRIRGGIVVENHNTRDMRLQSVQMLSHAAGVLMQWVLSILALDACAYEWRERSDGESLTDIMRAR